MSSTCMFRSFFVHSRPRAIAGSQLLRCPLGQEGSQQPELMEMKGGPWRSVQIQSNQARFKDELADAGVCHMCKWEHAP